MQTTHKLFEAQQSSVNAVAKLRETELRYSFGPSKHCAAVRRNVGPCAHAAGTVCATESSLGPEPAWTWRTTSSATGDKYLTDVWHTCTHVRQCSAVPTGCVRLRV